MGYSVTISWGAQRYKYVDEGIVWETSEGKYKTSAQGRWEPIDANGNVNEAVNMVTAINNSDRHISVKAEFVPTEEVGKWQKTVDGVDYGISYVYQVQDPSDSEWHNMVNTGNLATRLDTSTAAQNRFQSQGRIKITGRPQFITSVDEMILGHTTITIGPYNQSYIPNDYDPSYQ
jgi:hypothetical protein